MEIHKWNLSVAAKRPNFSSCCMVPHRSRYRPGPPPLPGLPPLRRSRAQGCRRHQQQNLTKLFAEDFGREFGKVCERKPDGRGNFSEDFDVVLLSILSVCRRVRFRCSGSSRNVPEMSTCSNLKASVIVGAAWRDLPRQRFFTDAS